MRFVLFLIVVVLAINEVHLGNLDIDCFANCFNSGIVDPICTKLEGTPMTAMNEQFITCLRNCGSNIEEVHKGKCPGDTKFDEMIEKLQKASAQKGAEEKQILNEKSKSEDRSEETGQDEILEDEILKDEL